MGIRECNPNVGILDNCSDIGSFAYNHILSFLENCEIEEPIPQEKYSYVWYHNGSIIKTGLVWYDSVKECKMYGIYNEPSIDLFHIDTNPCLLTLSICWCISQCVAPNMTKLHYDCHACINVSRSEDVHGFIDIKFCQTGYTQ